ncbi:MAG TPA: hypothetical protein VLS89_20240, partial [Candidatus Nanopelagicales bacterium]|nr:hypothetical protein [Candidatus Nanopelagicales bacterium]
KAVWSAVEISAASTLPEPLRPPPRVDADPGNFLLKQLSCWAAACPKPIALILDEIDALEGQSLKSVLSQLRLGYTSRPAPFPWSVILCGMRDVRDYKAASGGGPPRLGSSSPFNVKHESLRLGNFTEPELCELYAQHTAETGQAFTEDALAHAFELSQGQPWLTNALASRILEKIRVPLLEPITPAHFDQAREQLILARETHLDSLLARLAEDRVRRVLEPVLAGELPFGKTFDADFDYVVDLGLVSPGLPVRIANPIYREVILRVLAGAAEPAVTAEPKSYIAPDGRLDIDRLLHDFAEFWRQHGEPITERIDYQEVAPQLVLLAWLHRIVNGGGVIDREVGVGRKRIDVLVRWPHTAPDGKRALQQIAIELKVWRDRDKKGDPRSQGLSQLDEYLTRLGLDEGVLVIFDARKSALPVEDRTHFEETTTPAGRRATLLRA